MMSIQPSLPFLTGRIDWCTYRTKENRRNLTGSLLLLICIFPNTSQLNLAESEKVHRELITQKGLYLTTLILSKCFYHRTDVTVDKKNITGVTTHIPFKKFAIKPLQAKETKLVYNQSLEYIRQYPPHRGKELSIGVHCWQFHFGQQVSKKLTLVTDLCVQWGRLPMAWYQTYFFLASMKCSNKHTGCTPVLSKTTCIAF